MIQTRDVSQREKQSVAACMAKDNKAATVGESITHVASCRAVTPIGHTVDHLFTATFPFSTMFHFIDGIKLVDKPQGWI